MIGRLFDRARPLMVAALLSLLVVPAARAQVPPDSTIGADWILDPPAPCVENGVTLWVRAFYSTPCDSFISAYRTAENLVVVRTLTREGFMCFAAPIPFGLPIAFGTLPAGGHNIVVRSRRLTLHLDGSIDSVTVDENVAFSVSPTCPQPVPVPAHELPYVGQVFTDPAVPCPERSTALVMRGIFPSGCGELVSAGVDDNGRLNLVLAPYPPTLVPCPAVLKGWNAKVRLGFFQTGHHELLIHQTLLGSGASWPPLLEQHLVGRFGFTVSAECESIPPPQPLPYVEFIHIGPARPDSSATLCADQPIKVSIGGTFPNDCYRLTGVQLLALGSPIPIPPIVRLLVTDGSCDPRLCIGGPPKPWETSVVLSGLPSRDYLLNVQMVKSTCLDSIPPDSVFSTQVPFHVAPAESCGIQPVSCLRYHWAPNSTPCHATVSADHPGFVTMTVGSGVALSGLQGTLRFHEMGLQVDGLEAVGPAAGMRLSWTRTSDGARFVMFAEQGAPIPATVTTPVEVLRVEVGAAPIRVAWPPAFHMSAGDLLGSDIDANAVPECFIRSPFEDASLPPVATICVERPCDFNADGAADVRDLVLMVRCVNQQGSCPPDPVASFDCDGDGSFALGDVLCCAVHVLRGPLCPQCPPDSVRVSNGRAELGTVSATETGAEVTVRLSQPQELGAARIGLKFPTDRFRLASVDLLNGSRWLELHEDAPTGATLGLIRLQPSPEVGEALEAVLRLELLPGRTRGGEIRLDSGDFSANDGVRLELERGVVVRSLGPAAALTLSRAQPNPFSGETRFSVTLESESPLEVGVFDPAGRLVRWIHRGVKGAGTHDFRWDGRTADGTLAREGMYFYRVRAGGHHASGKVALLRVR